MTLIANVANPCALKKDRCLNCHSHFSTVRPFIKEAALSKRFLKDLKDPAEAQSIANAVLDCSSVDFFELHKFEETVNGNMIFCAKKEGVHLVYSVDPKMRLVFLRAFQNYSEYGKFLADRREVLKALANASTMER